MPRSWIPSLVRLLGFAGIGLLIGALFGTAWGLGAFSAALLAQTIIHTHYLSRLVAWIANPETIRLPDGSGAWTTVFSELYRAHRRQERSQHRLVATIARFRQAASALPDGILILSADNYIEWCNALAEAHFEIDAGHDRGLLITNLVRAPQFAEYLAAQNVREALILRMPGGTALSIQLAPFEQTTKLLVSRDVTQLERVETIRRDFIANVSHELRTPLTVLGGFLETLSESEPLDVAAARKYLPLMHEQAQRMQRLVDDLLMLSQLESHGHVIREDAVDMGALLSQLEGEARTLSRGQHHITLEAADVPLLGSEEELRSAFGNLINNAVRYTPAGGRVNITWKIENGAGVFRVEDDGVGIAPEHVPRLTERFYRVDRGRSRETGGTGLGLAIVKHVLTRHQAALDIRSAPGLGSTFTAVFPSRRVIAAAHQAVPA